jgi:hypothetical protein
LTGPDGGTFIGGGVASRRTGGTAVGAVLIGPDGGTFIGGCVGSLRADSLRSSVVGGATLVGMLSPSPVTLCLGVDSFEIGCVAVRGGGVLAGAGRGGPVLTGAGAASASGLSSGSGASASRAAPDDGGGAGRVTAVVGTTTAGIPIIVPVVDLALRMTRPFDHNSSV